VSVQNRSVHNIPLIEDHSKQITFLTNLFITDSFVTDHVHNIQVHNRPCSLETTFTTCHIQKRPNMIINTVCHEGGLWWMDLSWMWFLMNKSVMNVVCY